MSFSDIARLTELMSSFGLEPASPDLQGMTRAEDDLADVVFRSFEGNVHGYNGFYVRFSFDSDGTFSSMGIYE